MVNDGHATGSRMVVVALALAMLALFVVNIFIGSTHVPPSQVLEVLGVCLGCHAENVSETTSFIILHSRLPQAVVAMFCGASLSVAGLMLQTAFPSWLYPVTQGATTIWEHWDSYTKEKGFGGQNAMNSFNHYSLGSVLSWLYHTGLGIQRDETKPGYQHILLKPQPGPLEFMKGSVDSPYGVISAGWERKGDKIEYQVTIPVNTTATLFKNTEDPADTVELGSGTYTFML